MPSDRPSRCRQRLIVYRNCFTGDVSGGDVHMSGMLSWLLDSTSDIEPVLVLPRGDGQAKVYDEVKRIKTITYADTRFRGSIALMYVLRALKAASKVNRFIEQRDILIASSHFLPDVLPVYVAHRKREHKAVFIHHIIQDMPRPKGLNTFLANLQEKLCFALIRHGFGKVIVVNQDVADRLRAMGFKKQQILLSSNFVQPTAEPQAYEQKDITLVFCGRMVKQKGVDDFVSICAQLAAESDNFRAVMIGVGPELARLKAYISTHQLPIEMVGYVNDATKYDLLSRARLFVFPSIEEGWGIAIAESLAVGTPVVAYELPVYKAIFGEYIHMVSFQDTQQLLSSTRQLLVDYAQSRSSYAQEQQRIVEHATQFRIERVAAKEYEFIGSTA